MHRGQKQCRAGHAAHKGAAQRRINQLPKRSTCRAGRMPAGCIRLWHSALARAAGGGSACGWRGARRCLGRWCRRHFHWLCLHDGRRCRHFGRNLCLHGIAIGCAIAHWLAVRPVARNPCHLPPKGRAQEHTAPTVYIFSPLKIGRWQLCRGEPVCLRMPHRCDSRSDSASNPNMSHQIPHRNVVRMHLITHKSKV